MLYEYAITFADEVRTVWKRPKTVTSLLFIFTRWSMAFTAVYLLLPSTNKVGALHVVHQNRKLIYKLPDVKLLFKIDSRSSRTYPFRVGARLRPSSTTSRCLLCSYRLQVSHTLNRTICYPYYETLNTLSVCFSAGLCTVEQDLSLASNRPAVGINSHWDKYGERTVLAQNSNDSNRSINTYQFTYVNCHYHLLDGPIKVCVLDESYSEQIYGM